jgi:hypothetical protein
MFNTIKVFASRSFVALVAVGLMAWMASTACANPWSWTLGDARAVQRKTEDIAERLNREFPYSQATLIALQMDNSACQLVESIKCGASWEQVQSLLSRTCVLAGQVNELANADCHVRNDRRTRDYINELSKRIERLHCNLDKAFAKTQPTFCPPASRHGTTFGVPYEVERGYPRDTYEFDSVQPFGEPSARPMSSIEYRVESHRPTDGRRVAAFVQLGLQAIQLATENR